MNTDILLRFTLAVVIITIGLAVYWLFNQRLLGRAQNLVL